MIDTIINLLKNVSNNIEYFNVQYEVVGREHFKIQFKRCNLNISVALYQSDSVSIIVCSGHNLIGMPVKIDITNSDDAYQIKNLFQEVKHKCQDYVINLLKSIK